MVITQIKDELERLKISENDHPVSGLSVAEAKSDYDFEIVKISDDYVDGHYVADLCLELLQKLEPGFVSLSSEDNDNIWVVLAEVEV